MNKQFNGFDVMITYNSARTHIIMLPQMICYFSKTNMMVMGRAVLLIRLKLDQVHQTHKLLRNKTNTTRIFQALWT